MSDETQTPTTLVPTAIDQVSILVEELAPFFENARDVHPFPWHLEAHDGPGWVVLDARGAQVARCTLETAELLEAILPAFDRLARLVAYDY